MSAELETRTKTYKSQADFNKDAEKMTRDGWSYDPQMIREGKRETESKTYKSSKDYENDSKRRIQDGWEVAGVVNNQPRSGCGRILLLGLFTLIWKPKPEITATYVKAEKIVTWTRPKQ